jgi:hypothetical protein
MECSLEIALSLLNKWKEEKTLLSVMMFTPRVNFDGAAYVIDCSSEGVRLKPPALRAPSGETLALPGKLEVGFEGGTFEYVEPREAPSDIRQAAEGLFDCILTVKVPDVILSLSVMRNQPATSSE